MTSGATTTLAFDESPEAPKMLPRATRAAKMLERAAAANLMIRTTPQSSILANKTKPSPVTNGYRFGSKSPNSFSTPSPTTTQNTSSSSTTTPLSLPSTSQVEASPRRSSSIKMFSSRGKAFLKALKTNESAEESKKISSESQSSQPDVESLPSTSSSSQESVDDSETSESIEDGPGTSKRKSILKPLNSAVGDAVSSPRVTSSPRIVNFRNPIMTQRLYDRFAAAKTVSETGNDDEGTRNGDDKVSNLKRKRPNDFVVDCDDDNDNNSVSDNNNHAQASGSSASSNNNVQDQDDVEECSSKKVRRKLNKLFDESEDWDISDDSQDKPEDVEMIDKSKETEPLPVVEEDNKESQEKIDETRI